MLKRDQVWQRPYWEKRRCQLKTEIQTYREKYSHLEALQFTLSKAKCLNHSSRHEGQLDAFIYAIQTLELHAEFGGLAPKEITQVERLASGILTRKDLKPKRSRLAPLFSEIHDVLAKIHHKQGKLRLSRWHTEISGQIGSELKSEPIDMGYEAVKELLNLGLGAQALRYLDSLDTEAEPRKKDLWKMQILRLSGAVLEALSLVPRGELSHQWEWERACCEVQLSGDLSPLTQIVGQPRFRTVRYNSEARLWGYCLSQLPNRSLRAHRRGPLIEDDSVLWLKAVQCFEQLYDAKSTVQERIEVLGTFLATIREASEIRLSLLVWAAAARWLCRTRQDKLMIECLSEYRKLSLSLSSGWTQDVLGVLTSVMGSRNECELSDVGKELLTQRHQQTSSVSPSSWARGFEITSLTFELIYHLGRKRLQQLFSNSRQSKRLREEEKTLIVDVLVRHLAQMKGPLMKLGQVSSYLGLDIPIQAQLRLGSLTDSGDSIAFSEIKEVIERDLKAPISKLFQSFDETPIGIGSIGQVHRAITLEGEVVAVKVQFPNIKKVVEKDLRYLKMLLPMLRWFAPKMDLPGLFDQLTRKLNEECNYLREARIQDHFFRLLRKESELRVPRVYWKYTSAKVLTSEFIDGLNFREFLLVADSQERNFASRTIARYLSESYKRGLFNTDPHTGNYLFHKSRIYVVDFGSVQEWNEKETQTWMDIMQSVLLGDYEQFKRGVNGMGMAVDKNSFDYKDLFEVYCSMSMRALQQESKTKFYHDVIREEVNALFSLQNKNIKNLSLKPSFLYGFRAYFSHLSLLASLNSPINWRKEAIYTFLTSAKA